MRARSWQAASWPHPAHGRLARTDASTASLLLTLEGVATALMAWFIFHENFDRRIALGMACLVAGAVVLVLDGSAELVGTARAARHRRRMRRLGARQQSHAQSLARRSAADRRAERPDRRPVNLALGLSSGGSLPGLSALRSLAGSWVSSVMASAWCCSSWRCAISAPRAREPTSRPRRSSAPSWPSLFLREPVHRPTPRRRPAHGHRRLAAPDRAPRARARP